VNELRDLRNKWAHQQSFSSDDAYRALDSAGRLITAVSAPQSDEIEKMKMELLRLRFDEQVRTEKRKTAGTAIESAASSNLKPWREVVTPHKDVASGRYQQAEFAADLWQVYLGEGTDEYRKPVEFFRRTYLTESLKRMLVGAVQRISGHGGDPVVQLQTNFGGGKTHSMLALYHLFSGAAASDLAGIDAVMQETDTKKLPAAKRVVLVGNRISPGNPVKKPDGTIVRTLWGEIAWQLGGKKAFDRLRADDEKATSPGDVLRELFNEYGPCLILIDEWVAYARQLHDQSDLPAGGFETQFTFAQVLTESAKLAKGCLLVISLPASDTTGSPHTQADDVEVGGQRGREALDRLRNFVGRVESSWRPASAEEWFEIVRRRLFEPLADQAQFKDRDVVARAFADLYRAQHQEFPPECNDADYEKRIKAAYASTGAFAWGPDQKKLAALSSNGAAASFRTWDVASGQTLFDSPDYFTYPNLPFRISWSQDGKKIITLSSWGVEIWDGTVAGKPLRSMGKDMFDSGVVTAGLSPDGKKVAPNFGAALGVWEAEGEAPPLILAGHHSSIVDLQWAPNGRKVVTTGQEPALKVWQVERDQEFAVTTSGGGAIRRLAFSSDGRHLAIGSPDKVEILDAATGETTMTLSGTDGVAWSPDNRKIATASADNTATIWDAESGKPLIILRGHEGYVIGLAWSRDGKSVATVSEDKTARIWDATTGAEQKCLRRHKEALTTVAWSPDGKSLMTTSSDGQGKLWEAGSWRDRLTIPVSKFDASVQRWSPDSTRVAFVSEGSARILDVATGRELRILSGGKLFTRSLAWSPDGKRLVTTNSEGTIDAWDAVSGRLELTLTGYGDDLHSIVWSPDNMRVAIGGDSGGVRISYALDLDRLMSIGHQRFLRSRPSDLTCQKYFMSDCPAFPDLHWW
jgi:WD40 repeat protein